MTQDLDAKTDRELLVITVVEMGHVKVHLKDLSKEAEKQNGRITALEKWRWMMTGGLILLTALWPLLVYEFRHTIAGALGG